MKTYHYVGLDVHKKIIHLLTHWVKVFCFFHCHYIMAVTELGGFFAQ